MATKKLAAKTEVKKKAPAINFGNVEESEDTTSTDETDEDDDESANGVESDEDPEEVAGSGDEEEVEAPAAPAPIVEIVPPSPKKVLRIMCNDLIQHLTKMGLLPASAEEFTITFTAEDDDEVELPIKVARDPQGFIDSIFEVITSGNLKKEDSKKFYEKVANFASKIDHQVEVADALGRAMAYFMNIDEEKKFNRVLTRMDKFEATAEPKFKILVMSIFSEVTQQLLTENAAKRAVKELSDDSL